MHTIHTVSAQVPCQACHGFWAQAPLQSLVNRYGKRVVSIIERKTLPVDRGQIRVDLTNRSCGRCAGNDRWTFAHSTVKWSSETIELLRRNGASRLDQQLATGRLRRCSTAAMALVHVVLGKCGPETLAHSDVLRDIDDVELDVDVLETLRTAR